MILAWVNGIYEGVEAFLVGMRTTAGFLVENVRGSGGATAVTRQYPQEAAVVVGDRVRGHLVNDTARCIVCFACDKACPVDCFVMEGERDRDNKMRGSRFDIDLSKCIYCGLCVRACPTGARHFGDLGDPESAVSKLVQERQGFDLLPEFGFKPVNKYLPPRPRRNGPAKLPEAIERPVEDTGSLADRFFAWADKALAR